MLQLKVDIWRMENIRLLSPLIFEKLFIHISKGPSGLKQNGTQAKKQFSGPVFHGLSCGVVCFVASVSFKNHQMEASHWLLEHLNQSQGGFWS